MIEFTRMSESYGSMIIWTCVKRMRDIKPHQVKDGERYLLRKTKKGPVLVYIGVLGKLKPTGYFLGGLECDRLART